MSDIEPILPSGGPESFLLSIKISPSPNLTPPTPSVFVSNSTQDSCSSPAQPCLSFSSQTEGRALLLLRAV